MLPFVWGMACAPVIAVNPTVRVTNHNIRGALETTALTKMAKVVCELLDQEIGWQPLLRIQLNSLVTNRAL